MIDCMRIMLTFYKLSMSIVVAYTFVQFPYQFFISIRSINKTYQQSIIMRRLPILFIFQVEFIP